jgi:hypothetical protein
LQRHFRSAWCRAFGRHDYRHQDGAEHGDCHQQLRASAAFHDKANSQLALFVPVSGHASWYVGHLGAELCVPLDNIGPQAERLYDGVGSMHIPEDYERTLRSVFPSVTQLQTLQGMAAWNVKASSGEKSFALLFDDKQRCEKLMEPFSP